jgi:hypothetical protein
MIKTLLIGLTAPFFAVIALAQELPSSSDSSLESSSFPSKPILTENAPQLAEELGGSKVVESSPVETERLLDQSISESSSTNSSGRDIASESDIASAKMAKEKAYPGGRDEDDLEVLVEREKPTRKMGGKNETESATLNENEF